MLFQYQQHQPQENTETLYSVMITIKDKTYDECECCGITCNIICCAACCDDIGEAGAIKSVTQYRKSELKQFVTDSFTHLKNIGPMKSKPQENFSIKIEIDEINSTKKITFTDMQSFDAFIANGTMPTIFAVAKPSASATRV